MPENVNAEEANEEYYLTEEESQDFSNLLTVGRVSKMIDILGHKVLIRTLSVAEDMAVGLLIKPYVGSNSFERAYKTAVVAAAVREIDSHPVVASLAASYDDMELIQAKFDKIKMYFPIVIDEIYKRFLKLEETLIPLAGRLGKTLS
jgi:hypothetical protein